MLDPQLQKQVILLKVPSALARIRTSIMSKCRGEGFEVLDLDQTNNEQLYAIRSHIKGAFIFNDNSFETGIYIGVISKQIQKIFILTETSLQIESNIYEICNISYKKIEEKISQYLETIQETELQVIIDKTHDGFSYYTSGDIIINPYEGLFISIDHPDGGGATTLARNIQRELEKTNLDCFFSEEPTNELLGGAIRTALRGRLELFPDALQLMYTVDRIEHSRLLYQALKSGKTVIESRYTLSTLMYSYKEVPIGFLIAANSQVYWPDITLLIKNVTPTTSITRVSKRLEGVEKFDTEDKLTRVNEGMDVMHKVFRGITYELDGTKDPESITKQALRVIRNHPKYQTLRNASVESDEI